MTLDRKSAPSKDKRTVDNSNNRGQEELERIRLEIDRIDQSISSLINERLLQIKKVADIKCKHNLPTLDEQREKEVFKRVLSVTRDKSAAQIISTLYDHLLRLSRQYQTEHLTSFTATKSSDKLVSEKELSSYFPRVALIGLGAVGGAIATMIKRHIPETAVIGWDISSASSQLAKTHHAIDELAKSSTKCITDCQLIILCAGPQANLDLLTEIAPFVKAGQIILDVTSAKSAICKAADNLNLHGADFIGGHPFFGSEKSGFLASSEVIPEEHVFCLVPTTKTSKSNLNRLIDWLTFLNLRVSVLTAAEHDFLAARTSHIIQLMAVLMANQLSQRLSKRQLADCLKASGNAFGSMHRLMKSPGKLWFEIIEQNEAEVQAALREFKKELDQLISSLESNDPTMLKDLFVQANSLAKILDEKQI